MGFLYQSGKVDIEKEKVMIEREKLEIHHMLEEERIKMKFYFILFFLFFYFFYEQL